MQALKRGFTLVEMMVIAPIVILLIGAFIALIVNLTGEVMSSRGSNVLTYNLQDALNQIEEDVKLSSTYLSSTNINISSTKQGYGGDTTNGSTVPFTNIQKSGGSTASLILNGLVTNGNPMSTLTGYVYLANSPNPCTSVSEYSNNRPMSMNIVYFVDSQNTLWRRVIMPSNYATASVRCGSAAPWQQPSCTPGYNTVTMSFCKTNDMRMIDGVSPSDFVVQYFSSASSTSADTTANNPTVTNDTVRNTALQATPTVAVTITAKQTVAGRDIVRAGTVRATRLDTNASSIAIDAPPTAVPAAPSVTSTVSDGHNVTFTWPRVATASSYDLEWRLNGGAWQAEPEATNVDNNSRSYTITNGGHQDTVEARVRATNVLGDSAWSSNSLTIPLWAPLILKGGWTDYAQGYSTAAYTKTRTGLVMLKGLVRNSGTPAIDTVIGTLPNDYVPSGNLIFGTITGNGGNDPGRIDVDPAGNVRFNTGGPSWISLESVRFVPADSPYTWTAPPLLNGWVNYGGVYAPAGYTLLSNGRAVTQGLVKSGTLTDGTPIFNLPASLTPPQYLHLSSRSVAYAGIGVSASPSNLHTKGNSSNAYLAVNSTYIPAAMSGVTWTDLSLVNSWLHYGSPFSTPQYTKTSDNIVQLKGLLRAGSTTYDSTIATLPAGFRPKTRILYPVTNYNNVHARVDIYPDGRVNFLGTSNSWLSIDSISFIAEQ